MLLRGRSQRIPVRLPAAERYKQIDPGTTVESFGNGQDFGFGERIGNMPTKAQIPAASGRHCPGEQPHTIFHQPLVGLARSVPFKHRKLGVMEPSPLTVAEHMRERVDSFFSGGEQFFDQRIVRAELADEIVEAVGDEEFFEIGKVRPSGEEPEFEAGQLAFAISGQALNPVD